MSIYTFYGMFCDNWRLIPKPAKSSMSLGMPPVPEGLKSYRFDPGNDGLGGITYVDFSAVFGDNAASSVTDPGARPDPPVTTAPDAALYLNSEGTTYADALAAHEADPDNVPEPYPYEFYLNGDQALTSYGADYYQYKLTQAWKFYDAWVAGGAVPTLDGDPVHELAYQILMYTAFDSAKESQDYKDWMDLSFLAVIMNGRFRKMNKKSQKEYREAVSGAKENEMIREKASATSEARRRGEDKKYQMQEIQRSVQDNKAAERRLISAMANQWAQNQKAEKKRRQG